MAAWGPANLCSGQPFHYPTPYDGDTDFWCFASEGQCAAPTVRCSFRGGHTWPFGSGGNNREKYARLVWDFFRQNPLPSSPAAATPAVVLGDDWSVEAVPPHSLANPPPPPYRCPEAKADTAVTGGH